MMQTDFLIIGSGVAGLTFALKCASRFPEKQVTIITKNNAFESNTRYAQGGIAVAAPALPDSYEGHIADTIKAGDGLCDERVVETVVKNGPQRLQELIDWGTAFDRTNTGSYHLGREGGHSVDRIYHRGDATGFEIENTLLKQIATLPNINTLQFHLATDLITENNTCSGAEVLDLNSKLLFVINAGITLLATGGAGQVYASTTNPLVATGDGIAMAARAGAKTMEMEFVQFHPTALYQPNISPAFLISEAVRGAGAILRTPSGEIFMHKYDVRKDLASRDIVSRAIFNEMRTSEVPYVLLDCTSIAKEQFEAHFPNISRKCREMGINISREAIPVAPAAHYICGGIAVDYSGNTSVKGLYACGECSRTGLHGANRLASNSLLEAVVYAHICFEDAAQKSLELPKQFPCAKTESTSSSALAQSPETLKQAIQSTMNAYAGIERNTIGLHSTKETISEIIHQLHQPDYFDPKSLDWHEVRNLADIALLIITQSLERTENKGGFFNTDLVPSTPELVIQPDILW